MRDKQFVKEDFVSKEWIAERTRGKSSWYNKRSVIKPDNCAFNVRRILS